MLIPTTYFNCESAYGLLAYVDKETLSVRKFEGNPGHPASRGRTCAKGLATLHQINDPDRILLSCSPASTLADGIAVRRVGDLTLPLMQRYIDEVVTVNETEIAHAILLLLEDEKTVVEGVAATTLAALLNRPLGLRKQKVVLLLAGGNIDVNIVARVIEKGMVQEGRVTRVSLVVPDRPAALAQASNIVAEQGANVLTITHTRGFSKAEVGKSELTPTLETPTRPHIDTVYRTLQKAGYRLSKE